MTETMPPPRPLGPADLPQVLAIDQGLTGRARRGFFEKRLQAAAVNPDGFVIVGLDTPDGTLEAHAFTRVQTGEFGDPRPAAVLDALGVSRTCQTRGRGRALIAALDAQLSARGIPLMRTQIGWAAQPLLRFFAAVGFILAPRTVLERPATPPLDPAESDLASSRLDSDIPDHSDPGGDDFVALSRDRMPVRSMTESDLEALVRIDAHTTGQERPDYYRRLLSEAMSVSGVRVSLVAEIDGEPVGFVMARVDYGEFGRAEAAAVVEAIGVDPGRRGRGVGTALISQLLVNLATLRVEIVRTTAAWDDFELLRFLRTTGFRPAQRLLLTRTVA